MKWMIAAPGAEALAEPFPKNMYASKIPNPTPGLASSKYRTDLPAFNDCSVAIGVKIPWLIALFKNKIFAGSINTLASGNKCALMITSTPALSALVITLTIGPIPKNPKIAKINPRIPAEKLFTNISNPVLIFG